MNKIKIISLVGARPQIIKASAISRAIKNKFSSKIKEVIVHTGQHYDRELSQVFFEELEIPKPDYNLGVGSARHGKQTALMLTGIEEVLLTERPDCLVIYGDTNSTLAGALAAVKQHFPVVHVEAGLRSFNKLMPEEINRIMSDHASTLLFAPTNAAFKNLVAEGFRPENSPPYSINNPKIYLTGDIMYDNSFFFSSLAEKKKSYMLEKLNIERDGFVLVTIHRDINTDDILRLNTILTTVLSLAEETKIPFVMPLHPRTTLSLKNNLEELNNRLYKSKYIRLIPPVSYLEMTFLEMTSRLIITDSGGVQKESHFFRKPCIVLRKETEWVELVKNGTVMLADADPALITAAFNFYLSKSTKLEFPAFYGDGKTAEFILKEILMMFDTQGTL
ncbi:MAG TPA: UDP-N-acetylglucosamine 2-epimerase (non-hydrolyzing) [Bacteroidales bacterium]|nr:UDP-N-acetylglucosamine 2-epimerase (non-hydrolyzing) [Bacteroidales bacterium]